MENTPGGLLASYSQAELASRVAAIDVGALPLSAIAALGADAEQALTRVLADFLTQIDEATAPRLFKLVDGLQVAVAAEDLPAVAQSILDARPSLRERLRALFSRQGLRAARDQAYQRACLLMQGKARSLADKIAEMEQSVAQEQARLLANLQTLEQLLQRYQGHWQAFLEAAALVDGLWRKAQSMPVPDSLSEAEWQDRLSALGSRALALENGLSRLPADQLLIRQLQQAGYATLQEMAATLAGRFNSIRMSLLSLHGARLTQDLQRLAESGAVLDANLARLRGQLVREVALNAARAPGEQALVQARQLQAIVADSQRLRGELQHLRQHSADQQQKARQLLAEARTQMLDLARRPSAHSALAVQTAP